MAAGSGREREREREREGGAQAQRRRRHGWLRTKLHAEANRREGRNCFAHPGVLALKNRSRSSNEDTGTGSRGGERGRGEDGGRWVYKEMREEGDGQTGRARWGRPEPEDRGTA